MPHFDLIDETNLTKREILLKRVQLHIRTAFRRLRDGIFNDGFATLYDAFVHAMQWYVLDEENSKRLNIREDDDITDEEFLFYRLKENNVIDSRFSEADFQFYYNLLDAALDKKITTLDAEKVIKDFTVVMEQLGIMPFDMSTLPPEKHELYINES